MWTQSDLKSEHTHLVVRVSNYQIRIQPTDMLSVCSSGHLIGMLFTTHSAIPKKKKTTLTCWILITYYYYYCGTILWDVVGAHSLNSISTFGSINLNVAVQGLITLSSCSYLLGPQRVYTRQITGSNCRLMFTREQVRCPFMFTRERVCCCFVSCHLITAFSTQTNSHLWLRPSLQGGIAYVSRHEIHTALCLLKEI